MASPTPWKNVFGTHPGEFSQELLAGTRSGNSFTFSHPQSTTTASQPVPKLFLCVEVTSNCSIDSH